MTGRKKAPPKTCDVHPTRTQTPHSMGHKHRCASCIYSTKYLGNLNQHLRVHSTEKPFKCPEPKCPFTAKWKRSITNHVKNVHQHSRPFSCSHPGCNYAAKLNSALKTHSKIHSKETPFSCSHPNCNFSTNQKSNLVVHTRVHTGEKPFVCQFESCSYASATSTKLVTHTRTHTKERPFKCPEPNCEYAAARMGDLKRHGLTHPSKEGETRLLSKCPLCKYSGKSKGHLNQHIKHSHTLEKFFKCDEPNCNFEARTKAEVKSHKLVHSDEKPFACSFESCEFRCKSKSNLSLHLQTHSEEKQYKCELCPFRGKLRGTVREHLKGVHSDQRPFKCTEPNCDYAGKRIGELNRHLLIHKGEKKYSCSAPNCGYRSTQKSHIKKHEHAIHNNVPN